MAIFVALYVKGMTRDVLAKLGALSQELGPDITVWRDPRDKPQGQDAEYSPYEGWIDVEVPNAERRADAIDTVTRAVNVIDPESEFVTGGDIFKQQV
jgi:hypothetical protein